MGESWIVSNLNAALSTWNDKLAEIWSLLTESPQTFKGGQVWGVMTGIHGTLQAIGYGLLVLFFAVGVMKTCGSFVEVKKPEHALKLFIRFALAKGAVTYGLELMLAVFSIVQGMVSTIITQSGSSGMSSVTLPQELIDAINNVGFWDSIPLWAVTLIGGLLITVLSFTMILTVYGRMFSLWMYAAIAPIPLSTFAGEPTSSVGKNFILHILRLNIRFYRVIIVTDDFAHVTIAYILLEFVIRYVFRTCTILVGQVQAQKHHGYDHIQPVQVELGHIDLIGLFVSVIIIVHRAY